MKVIQRKRRNGGNSALDSVLPLEGYWTSRRVFGIPKLVDTEGQQVITQHRDWLQANGFRECSCLYGQISSDYTLN